MFDFFKNKRKSSKNNCLFLSFAAAYLLYTDFTLFHDLINENDMKPAVFILVFIAVIVFFVAAAFTIVVLIKTYKKMLAPPEPFQMPDYSAFTAEAAEDSDANSSADETQVARILYNCVVKKRDILSSFNKDHYAKGFSSFSQECYSLLSPYLSQISDADSSTRAKIISSHFVNCFKNEYDNLPRSMKRNQSKNDKLIMALYFSPMLIEMNTPFSIALAESVCSYWNASFPENQYKIGTYSRILAGFDHRLPFLGKLLNR